jgi:hypothetical protein
MVLPQLRPGATNRSSLSAARSFTPSRLALETQCVIQSTFVASTETFMDIQVFLNELAARSSETSVTIYQYKRS